MEISEEKLEEIKESSYIQGQKRLLSRLLGNMIGELDGYQDVSKERLIMEREETIASLRSICDDFGDNEWKNNMWIPDVLGKHLEKYLYAKE